MRFVCVLAGLNPLGAGASERDRHLVRALQQMGSVTVVVLGSASQPAIETASERYGTTVLGGHARRRSRARAITRYLAHPREPIRLARLDESANQECLAGLAREADLVLYRGALAHWVGRKATRTPCVTDLDDLYSNLIQQLLNRRVDRPRRALALRFAHTFFLREERRRWRQIEASAVAESMLSFVCSRSDSQSHVASDRTVVVPNGVDPGRFGRGRTVAGTPPRICMWGLMRYPPNREGAEWFVTRVWPLIREHRPDAVLSLVGIGSEQLRIGEAEGVELAGFVPDLAAFLQTVDVAVVPLHLGTGTRIKIVEAWAAGIPVVSTAIGSHGLGDDESKPVITANEPADFAAGVIRLIDSDETRAHLIREGHRLASTLLWPDIEQELVRAVQRALLPDDEQDQLKPLR